MRSHLLRVINSLTDFFHQISNCANHLKIWKHRTQSSACTVCKPRPKSLGVRFYFARSGWHIQRYEKKEKHLHLSCAYKDLQYIHENIPLSVGSIMFKWFIYAYLLIFLKTLFLLVKWKRMKGCSGFEYKPLTDVFIEESCFNQLEHFILVFLLSLGKNLLFSL